MNIVQLEYFLSVAETGSFRKTSEMMYVSQPAVSKQISLLEKEWNVVLFDRSYRVATLTEAGKLMYRKLSGFRDEFSACLKDARLIDKHATTELRVGIMERVDLSNLPDIFAEFQDAHPDILLTVEQVSLNKLTLNSSDSRYDMVLNHDLAFTGRTDLEIHEVARSRRMVILSRRNPVLKNGTLRFEDLNNQRFYIPGSESESLSLNGIIRICSAHGLNGIDYVVVPNLNSVIMSVQMNFGVGLVDETVLLPLDGSVLAFPFGDDFGIDMAWHKGNENPAISIMAKDILTKLRYKPGPGSTVQARIQE